jgi:23S rRNA (pseudouridine1915-N3)-methyltransferase
MHLKIITIGKDRREEFAPAIQRYQKQLPWKLEIVEKQPKKPNAPVEQRMQEEALLILAAAEDCTVRVALDEHGKVLTSQDLASKLGSWRDTGQGRVAFFIGGADGLHPDLLARCDMKLAFGAMTWPHQMVRLMLVEQLYRAYTLLSGHPYHRS